MKNTKMETNDIELRDEHVYPDEEVLRAVLGASYRVYSLVLDRYAKNAMTHEWRYYRDGKAWLCKVQNKKRTIVWMSVRKGYLRATIYFPWKHLERLHALDLDPELMRDFRSAEVAGKSIPCVFAIRNRRILEDLEKVVRLKIECL